MKKKSDIEFLSETEESDEILFFEEEKETPTIPSKGRTRPKIPSFKVNLQPLQGLVGRLKYQLGNKSVQKTLLISLGCIILVGGVIGLVSVFITLNTASKEKPREKTPIAFDVFDPSQYELSTAQLIDQDQKLTSFFLEQQYSDEAVIQIASSCKNLGIDQIEKDAEYQLGFHPGTGARIMVYDLPVSGRFFIFANQAPWVKERKTDIVIGKREWLLRDSLLHTLGKTGTGIPLDMVFELEEILSWTVGMKELKRGHRIDLLTEIRRIGTQNVGKENILALKVDMGGKQIKAYKFSLGGKEEFYNEEGIPLRRQFLRSPIKYGIISSKYNLERLHPVLRRVQPHKGTDFAAPEGSDIYAIGAGKVIRKGFTAGNGNFVEIEHDGTYSSMYLHMSRFVPGMKKGDYVEQGQLIGFVGSTGLSSGPHVCLRFKRWKSQIDILSATFDKPSRLSDWQWEAFQIHRDSLEIRLDQPGV
ncbi:MAG: M23 family metallopeptidase [Bacteroidota bacterium]